MSLLRRKKDDSADLAAEPDVEVGETTKIGDVVPRQFTRIAGTVVLVKSRPGHGIAALTVLVGDSTGRAMVVWTGRRSIGGIGVGRKLLVEGVPTKRGRNVEFTNPVYTLLPR